MSKEVAIGTIVVLAALLSACASQPRPLGWNDPFEPIEEEAIVFVGAVGESQVQYVTRGVLTVGFYGTGNPDVMAYRVKIGTPFYITQVYYPPKDPRSVPHSSYSYANIDGYTLVPEEHGIYYYGTIYNRGDEVAFSENEDQIILREFESRYRSVVGKMKPVNY